MDMAKKLLHSKRRLTAMNHRMAIRANGYQVFNWIDLVFFANLPNRNDVVNVNKSFAKSSKYFGKIESADRANMAVMCDASCTSFRIALVSVNRDGESCAFRIFFGC